MVKFYTVKYVTGAPEKFLRTTRWPQQAYTSSANFKHKEI